MTDTASPPAAGEMQRTLTLTGITVNAMALIAPGAFLWTTFQLQSAQIQPGTTTSTAQAMLPGLIFALVLALFTAYSYSELARIYPDAGTGSSYYFAEAALLEKEKPQHRKWARTAKLTIGWISHLYYWMYPGIMVAFTGTLFGYIYTSITGNTLNWLELALVALVFAGLSGYIAFRGVSGSTMASIVINVIQITTLILVSILFVAYRLKNPDSGFENAKASEVIIPAQFVNVLFQSTIAILLLVGFESVTALGAEAKNPQKDIKRGVLLSLIIQGGICYMIQYFAANFAVGAGAISSVAADGTPLTGYSAAAVDPAPIGTMLTNVGDNMLNGAGKTISLIVATTVLIALIGTTLACLNTGVRVTYAMARDKEMPAILGLLHGKFATPHGGVWVLTGISALLGMYGVNPASADNVTQITTASNTGTFLVYGMSCLVTITAFAHRHDRQIVKHYVVPAIGTIMNIVMLLAIVYLAFASGGSTAKNAVISLSIVAVWLIAGVAWVVLNPSKKGDKLIQSDAPKREVVPVG